MRQEDSLAVKETPLEYIMRASGVLFAGRKIELAKICDMSYSTLQKICSGEASNPGYHTVMVIKEALQQEERNINEKVEQNRSSSQRVETEEKALMRARKETRRQKFREARKDFKTSKKQSDQQKKDEGSSDASNAG